MSDQYSVLGKAPGIDEFEKTYLLTDTHLNY